MCARAWARRWHMGKWMENNPLKTMGLIIVVVVIVVSVFDYIFFL